MRIQRERLLSWLEELYLPANHRAANVAKVIEVATREYKGPYWGNSVTPTEVELIIIPTRVTLGIAVRLAEIERALTARPSGQDFRCEIGAARAFWERAEIQDPTTISPDAIHREQIVPNLVSVGYESVDDSDMVY